MRVSKNSHLHETTFNEIDSNVILFGCTGQFLEDGCKKHINGFIRII